MFKKIFKAISDWYHGEYVLWENDPNSDVIIIGHDHKLHWTAKIFRKLVEFYLKHWKWIWSTFIALSIGLSTLYVSYQNKNQSLNSKEPINESIRNENTTKQH